MLLVVRWLLNAGALYLTTKIVSGIVVEGTGALLLAALIIGLLNAVLKPVLVVLTLPITILSLGLFYLVLNGILFALASVLTPGFSVAGFGAAFLGALVMSVLGILFHALLPGVE
ncbi:MAG: phage holin family protein [Candidatus Palauibacterales bacterium]|nr:phage holin family protein [Candidatus Palauibacterales bacterium]